MRRPDSPARRDRIWLAGDAGHTSSPIGFQSMNRGLSEASAAASILGDAIMGSRGSPSELFRKYDETQQSEWRRLGIETRVVGQGVLSGSEGARLVPSLPASGSDLDALMAQLGLKFA